MTTAWTNWSQNISATPVHRLPVGTTEALHDAVYTALSRQQRIKAIGAGHSFTAIAAADDVQLDLTNYTGLVAFDQHTGRATFRAGTRLWQLPALLATTGWALQNLGDINQQSLAGAISTSTHGTGTAFGGLASQVVGLQLITGTGQLVTATDTDTPELLSALRVGLGAFGILTTITLQLVPAYDLHTIEEPATLDWVLDNWHDLHNDHDHFEFFWFGHDTNVQTKRSQRHPPTGATGPGWRRGLLDAVVTDGGLAALCQLGRLSPNRIPQLNRIATTVWGRSDTTAHWSTGFTSSRRVRFNEMEYAIPYADVPEVVAELRTVFQRGGIASTFPLEIRAAAPETSWLATNHERASGYIAVHQYFRQDYRQYFAALEPILQAAGGRPHWGKLHTMTADGLAVRYPKWEAVLALRDKYDPNRAFTNTYLAQVFGD